LQIDLIKKTKTTTTAKKLKKKILCHLHLESTADGQYRQYIKCENAAMTGTRANKPLLYWEETSLGKSEDNSDNISILFTGEELDFDIWEGNVTALWDPPEGSPIDALYQVALTQ